MATVELTYVINLDRDGIMTDDEFLQWIDQNMYEVLETGIGEGTLQYDPVIDLEDWD